MFLKYNLFGIFWAVIILFLSIISGGARTNIEIGFLDKLVHLSIYGVLSFLFVVGLKKQYAWPVIRFNAGYYAVGLSIVYGILMEFIQYFIPDRGYDYKDMIANAVGSILGYVLFTLIYKRF
jgi:VanZ family protein